MQRSVRRLLLTGIFLGAFLRDTAFAGTKTVHEKGAAALGAGQASEDAKEAACADARLKALRGFGTFVRSKSTTKDKHFASSNEAMCAQGIVESHNENSWPKQTPKAQ